MIQETQYKELTQKLSRSNTKLVAVSKLKSVIDIEKLYHLGQRDFGENYVQELVEKHTYFKENNKCHDIKWHFIGHLQSNKVKYIAPFVHLIHGIDKFKLLKEVNKQAQKCNRKIACLLQIHIAEEESKFGLDEKETIELLDYFEAQVKEFTHVSINGMMGMASFSSDQNKIKSEFRNLYNLFDMVRKSYFLGNKAFSILSMGMSGDYELAIEEGSNMVRIGSLLFGNRKQ